MYKNKYFKSLLYRNKLHEKDMWLYQATFQDFSALIHLNFCLFQFKVHVFTKFEKGSYVVWIWELLFYLQLSHLSNIHLQYDLKWSFMFVSYVFFTVDYNNTRVSLTFKNAFYSI